MTLTLEQQNQALIPLARDPAGFVAKGFRSSGHLVPGTDIGSPTPEPNPSETTTSLDSPHVNHDPLVTLADETVSNDYRHLPWDPNCCRFTETCYVIMNRDMSIARSENRVINAINDPDAVLHGSMGVQLSRHTYKGKVLCSEGPRTTA